MTTMTAVPARIMAYGGTAVEVELGALEVTPLPDGSGAELYARSNVGRKPSMNIRLDTAGTLDLIGALQDSILR